MVTVCAPVGVAFVRPVSTGVIALSLTAQAALAHIGTASTERALVRTGGPAPTARLPNARMIALRMEFATMAHAFAILDGQELIVL